MTTIKDIKKELKRLIKMMKSFRQPGSHNGILVLHMALLKAIEGLEHGDDTAKTLNSIIKIWEEQK